MTGEHYRYCVECEEEFRPGIVTCSDCGGPLVDRYEGMAPPEPAEEDPRSRPGAVDPATAATLAVADDGAEAGALARALAEAGIPYVVQPVGYGAGFKVLVPEERLDDARAHLPASRRPAPDDFHHEKGYAECPACGRAGVGGLAECPECGLVLKAAGGPEGGGEPPG